MWRPEKACQIVHYVSQHLTRRTKQSVKWIKPVTTQTDRFAATATPAAFLQCGCLFFEIIVSLRYPRTQQSSLALHSQRPACLSLGCVRIKGVCNLKTTLASSGFCSCPSLPSSPPHFCSFLASFPLALSWHLPWRFFQTFPLFLSILCRMRPRHIFIYLTSSHLAVLN